MLKTVTNVWSKGKFSHSLKTLVQVRRWFLSPAYRCQDAWDRRLDSPILRQIKLDDFHYEVDVKYQNKHKISAIDVDLFANAARGSEHLDEVEDLVHKLRLGPSTVDTLPSTQHAFVRLFLDAGQGDELLRILNDRINYGMFLDHYTACLLMDTFLQQNNYTAAAQVGVLQMLQEDWEDELMTHLAVYSCHMHLKHPGRWQPEEVPEPPDDGEEVKVRVKYIRNPYFDDHFDLRDPKLLVGKTLAAAAARIPGPAGRTYHVLGWALYEKWEQTLSTLERLVSGQEEPLFYKEGVERLQALVEEALQKEDCVERATLERLAQQVQDIAASSRVTGEDLTEVLADAVKRAAAEEEPRKVAEQHQTYEAWERLREERLQEELAAVRREQRREEIAQTLKDLERRERTIFFFDNQEQWELEAEQNEEKAIKAAAITSKKKVQADTEEYIPPEIRRPRT